MQHEIPKEHWNQIEIHTPYIQLEQLLKYSGIAETGAVAKDMILSACVFLTKEEQQDTVCLQRGKKIYPGDTVVIELQSDEWAALSVVSKQ